MYRETSIAMATFEAILVIRNAVCRKHLSKVYNFIATSAFLRRPKLCHSFFFYLEDELEFLWKLSIRRLFPPHQIIPLINRNGKKLVFL